MLSPLNEITNTQYNCITNFPCNCTAFPVYLSLLRCTAAYSPGKLLRARLEMGRRIPSFSDYRPWEGRQRSARCYMGQLNKHWLGARAMMAVNNTLQRKQLMLVAGFYSSLNVRNHQQVREVKLSSTLRKVHMLWEGLILMTMDLVHESCSL